MTWTVLLRDELILEIFLLNEEKAEITQLNLKPVGLDVFGDQMGLHTGDTVLFQNLFSGVHTMIAGGTQKIKKESPNS